MDCVIADTFSDEYEIDDDDAVILDDNHDDSEFSIFLEVNEFHFFLKCNTVQFNAWWRRGNSTHFAHFVFPIPTSWTTCIGLL